MVFTDDDGEWKRRIEELERHVARLQREVLGHSDIQLMPASGEPGGVPVSSEVRRLVDDGNLIGAMKVLRDETGMSLKQAKDVVEGL